MNYWWTQGYTQDRNGLKLMPDGDAWRVTGTATAPNTGLGAWLLLEAGDYLLTTSTSDNRLSATLGLNSTEHLLNSTNPQTVHLNAGRYIAYIRCNVSKGESIDSTIDVLLQKII